MMMMQLLIKAIAMSSALEPHLLCGRMTIDEEKTKCRGLIKDLSTLLIFLLRDIRAKKKI